jgi:hypothetical protein
MPFKVPVAVPLVVPAAVPLRASVTFTIRANSAVPLSAPAALTLRAPAAVPLRAHAAVPHRALAMSTFRPPPTARATARKLLRAPVLVGSRVILRAQMAATKNAPLSKPVATPVKELDWILDGGDEVSCTRATVWA